jgi:hypothetical protein
MVADIFHAELSALSTVNCQQLGTVNSPSSNSPEWKNNAPEEFVCSTVQMVASKYSKVPPSFSS